MVKITRLETQKDNPDRLNVYLEGEFGFGINRKIAPWLEVGRELTSQKITELQELDQFEKAYQRAIRYLSYRSRSEEEVRRNLRKHQIPQALRELVLDRLRDQSLVNDHKFAEEWVENRTVFHPRGKKALAAELYQKGIPRQIIDRVVEDVNEQSLAEQVAQKYLSRVDQLDREEFQRKLFGYLTRRGFHYSLSKQVVDQFWKKLQEE